MKLRLKEEALAASLRFYHVFQLVMEREQYDNQVSKPSYKMITHAAIHSSTAVRSSPACVYTQLVTMASLSLAAKVHEAPVKLSDVINTCYRSVIGSI